MPLSWNEIKTRATAFALEWKDSKTVREKAEAQTFEAEFLKIFGVDRKKVALFEHEVHFENSNERGYIDLFWKGRIIIEMKTPGKDLDKAYEQAKAYALSLSQKDIPKCILTCDFLNFQYYDLENDAKCYSFPLAELPAHVELFGHLAGYKDVVYQAASAVDIEAAEHMGELHDALKENRYTGHELEMYLVRLLFCLFADDSGIFGEKKVFYHYIMNKTSEDGNDLALHLGLIFEMLNKPEEQRQTNRDEVFKKFPYVNGGLFEERLSTAAFNSKMRDTILKCCTLDWSQIKPEIFGAMFQSIKDKEMRRELGEHYTSETNILKVIKPLFLDELWAEFEKIKKSTSAARTQKLLEFHAKLQRLKFFDPACGCGNFLVVSYRELRLLEIEVLSEYLQTQQVLDIELMVRVNVDQFYGIEIEEFPARIAQTALWLMDHLMNMKASAKFGKYIARIPLTASPNITIGNALSIEWESIIPKTELSYIFGNPPFNGARWMSETQKNDMFQVFGNIKGVGNLDYVTAWYKKAADMMNGTTIYTAFVSTNSISQGEQVAILWKPLMGRGLSINFYTSTFKWSNEAKGKAAVHCIIIGFSYQKTKPNISPYLLEAPTVFIERRTKPLCNSPEMIFGSMANDGSNLIIEEDEYKIFVEKEPSALPYIKRFMMGDEFINNKKRWCLWLTNISPSTLKKLPLVMERVAKCQSYRLESNREATRKGAEYPSRFMEVRQPDTDYIAIPKVSSERRRYIPIGYLSKEIIAGDKLFTIINANLYHFGILTSTMHMAWMRQVCGRLEMRYSYSNTIVYNNFPWPTPTEKQKSEIEKLAQAVLDARAQFPNSSLADLYDPVAMPPALSKAHQKLDKVVESAYGRTFTDDSQRVAYLFELYQKLSGELFVDEKKTGKRKKGN